MNDYCQNTYNYYEVSCIDKQIAELTARKAGLLSGVCFTGHLNTKTYLDPYNLDIKGEKLNG